MGLNGWEQAKVFSLRYILFGKVKRFNLFFSFLEIFAFHFIAQNKSDRNNEART